MYLLRGFILAKAAQDDDGLDIDCPKKNNQTVSEGRLLDGNVFVTVLKGLLCLLWLLLKLVGESEEEMTFWV